MAMQPKKPVPKGSIPSKGSPVPQPKKAPPPPPPPVEEEIEEEEEMAEEEEGTEEEGMEGEEDTGMGPSDEEMDQACDTLCEGFQARYAGMRGGPRPEVGDVNGWVDELAVPLILAFIQWWRNRRQAMQSEGEEGI